MEGARQDFNSPRYWAEWHWEPPWTAGRWALTNMPQGGYELDRKWIFIKRLSENSKTRELDQFQITILAQRNWRFFFWRVMLMLFVINLATVMALLFETFNEAMIYLSGMLLVIVTFSLTTSSMIPHVAYLTYLDFYVYGSYVFMCSVVLELSFARIMVHKEQWDGRTAGDVRHWMWRINSILMCVVNVIWVLLSTRAHSFEQKAFDSLTTEEVKKATRVSWTRTRAWKSMVRKTEVHKE